MESECLILPCSKYNKRTELGNNSVSFKELSNGIKVSYRHFGSTFRFWVILCSLKFMTLYVLGSFLLKKFRFRSHVYLNRQAFSQSLIMPPYIFSLWFYPFSTKFGSVTYERLFYKPSEAFLVFMNTIDIPGWTFYKIMPLLWQHNLLKTGIAQ